MDFLWRLSDVGLSGRNGEKRLSGINIQVREGTTAIIGHSGSGKTSLLNILTGFEKPDTGTVIRNIRRNNSATEIFWSPHNGGLWPHLSVEEHLAAVSGGGSSRENDSILELFELVHRRASRPGELSRGECSRLSIARAIAADPAVLVLDEPLVNIDSSRRRKLWNAIVDHIRSKGKSLVYATHSPSHITGTADTAICLSAGLVAYCDNAEKLYLSPPDRELASSLGEINWIDSKDCPLWLGIEAGRDIPLRPEQIRINADPEGKFKVASCSFDGELMTVQLCSRESGAERIFFTLPEGRRLAVGEYASISITRSDVNS